MNTLTQAVMALSVGIFVTMFAPKASAACGDLSTWQGPLALAQPNLESRSAATAEAGPSSGRQNPSIVGMWQVQFVSKGNANHTPPIPDGTLIDFGYSTWHSDGTEILNSGMRAPATGNFCLGVWTKIGSLSFEVNHFALGYDATTGALTGTSNIHEAVNLSTGGNSFTGTFAIDVYDPMGNQLDHIGGNTSGQRVTLDTTIQ